MKTKTVAGTKPARSRTAAKGKRTATPQTLAARKASDTVREAVHGEAEVKRAWIASAREAGLRYVTDARPGIQRLRRGKEFRYVDPAGKPVRDRATLVRIRSLVLPPAWESVWICPVENGHLQATGRDARGRKQSRYHPRWRSVRDETKYHRIERFGAVLPGLRKQVDHDLALHGMPRDKILATIVRLIETTYIRVGNEEYARENKSYGLTTMLRRHVEIHGASIQFVFRGKSGVEHSVGLKDRRIANILQRSHDLPGQHLFEYVDHDGKVHAVGSSDVNEYLERVTGEHFTAKDFRTWAGTVLATTLLSALEPFGNATQAKRNVVAAIAEVASRLGNTPSVCRKCYVHPTVLERYLAGSLVDSPQEAVEEAEQALDPAEAAMLRMIAAQVEAAATA